MSIVSKASSLTRSRRARTSLLLLAAVLSSTSAFAAGGKDDTVKGERGGGATSGNAGSGNAFSSAGSGETGLNPDRINNKPTDKKWEVGASFEAHRLLIQNDLQGAGRDKFFNYYQVYASWLPTHNDSLSVYFGAYQRFVADPVETGFRLDDVVLRYSHYFDLPANSRIVTRASVYLPTSFSSHKQGLLGAGRLTLGVEKLWGKYVLTRLRANGTGYLQQYDSPVNGGNPNPLASLSGSAELRVNMPFHTPLYVGLEGYTSYTWYLQTHGSLPPGAPGTTPDAYSSTQPIQQSFGGEVFVGYDLPDVAGIKSEIHFALAQGDPALGYNSALHDGISHTYFYWRETSEIYGSLLARY